MIVRRFSAVDIPETAVWFVSYPVPGFTMLIALITLLGFSARIVCLPIPYPVSATVAIPATASSYLL